MASSQFDLPILLSTRDAMYEDTFGLQGTSLGIFCGLEMQFSDPSHLSVLVYLRGGESALSKGPSFQQHNFRSESA